MKSWKKLWLSVCNILENNIMPIGEEIVFEEVSNEVQSVECLEKC